MAYVQSTTSASAPTARTTKLTSVLTTTSVTTIPSVPGHVLKRAGNLLTSTGQPAIKDFDEILSRNDRARDDTSRSVDSNRSHREQKPNRKGLIQSTDPLLPSSAPTAPKLKLSASIKRKFREVKESAAGSLGRSKSLNSGSGAGTNEIYGTGNRLTPTNRKRKPSDGIHTRSASMSTSRPSVTHYLTNASPIRPRASTSVVEHSKLPSVAESSFFPATQDDIPATSPNSKSQLSPDPPSFIDITVPLLLQRGTLMTKVSNNKRKKAVFRLDPNLGQIIWESKQYRIIPIENIKELRSTSDARYYREQFQLAAEYEERWLSIVYIIDGAYKTLHLIAPTREVFKMWDDVLRKMYEVRRELMNGGGHSEVRDAIWERKAWGSGVNPGGSPSTNGNGTESIAEGDRLAFPDVERMCKWLNINSSVEELERLFQQADVKKRGYLDFEDFRLFVKLLKGRPEIDRLFRKMRDRWGGVYFTASESRVFDFGVFEKFMKEKQKSNLPTEELKIIFERYSVPLETKNPSSPLPVYTKCPGNAFTPTSATVESTSPTTPAIVRYMTPDTFTSFLLSPDNLAFVDHHAKVTHDMTHPLSDYYVSSSHNTYLVGHQLVGISTIEGYIRALLHSCRSVELDIYDGDLEPMIFHGKTFTSKVSLREVCVAIKKYGFVASPYPIIISAEVHCGLAGQDMIAEIMGTVFGEALVKAPVYGRPKIEHLPSPEELKGRILLKTKNLYIARMDSSGDVDYMSTEMSASTSASSTSDSDVLEQVDGMRKPRRRESDAVKELKEDLMKRGSNVLQRVRSVGKSSASASSAKSTNPSSPSTPQIKLVSPNTSSSSELDNVARLQPHYFAQSIVSSPPNSPPLATPATPSAPRMVHTYSTGSNGTPTSASASRPKPKMSFSLLALLVYTVGVKFRGINKKEVYAPEHMFSLSETMANRMIKVGIQDLIKHCRTHLVRVYPKGLRLNSTNYEPHRYWSAGMQLVAINWQTFDLGYMINHAMFQRNGRSGYVLKPLALRGPTTHKDLLSKRTYHHFDVHIISAQQLPRPKDSSGRETNDKSMVDPFVEVSIHVPDWTNSPYQETNINGTNPLPVPAATAARTISYRTGVVKNNGFNPVWEEKLRIPFDCVGDMKDLIFVRFVVKHGDRDDVEPLAVYCASLGSLGHGYRHLPLHDTQLSQYLFSTLFVRIGISDN